VEFEDLVMARVSAAAWRASQDSRRKSSRAVLVVTLFAAAAAAAMLAVRYSGSSPEPATLETKVLAPGVAQSAAPASAPAVIPAVPPTLPPTVTTAVDINRQCASANATSTAPAYTVLVLPLQFEVDDPAVQFRVNEYYDALLDQLRKVPGLALVRDGAQATGTKPADFRITVGGTNDLNGKPVEDRAAGRMTVALETWTGSAFGDSVATGRDVRSLDADNCPASPGAAFNCGPAAAAALDAGVALRRKLPRIPTPVQAACNQSTRQVIAQNRSADTAADISPIRLLLERLAGTQAPTARASTWSILRNQLRPELVTPLVAALRDATDDALRKELVTLLDVGYADSPAAREALADVAASGPDTLMRHVAERAVSDNWLWLNYAVTGVRDTSKSTAQRLEAWNWMADAMPLDQQTMKATLSDTLTALQEADGVRMLAELLAATQKNPRGPGYGLAGQQGQWTLRQIAAVKHPAVPDLLITCFDAEPNYVTLGVLAVRRDDSRVAGKLESIATHQADPDLRRQASSYLQQLR
jgi:flagellar basal body-associated protein FliL